MTAHQELQEKQPCPAVRTCGGCTFFHERWLYSLPLCILRYLIRTGGMEACPEWTPRVKQM